MTSFGENDPKGAQPRFDSHASMISPLESGDHEGSEETANGTGVASTKEADSAADIDPEVYSKNLGLGEENVQLIINNTATQLEDVLEEIKVQAKTTLDEIAHYVNEANQVTQSWTIAQQSEHQEAVRIDQVEPDVQGMTMLQQQQQM